MEQKIFRVAIFGTGWGIRVQIPALRKAGLEVAAIYSRSQQKADELAKTHNVPLAASNVDTILSRSDIHLISIVTPPGTHLEYIRKSLQAGKHVLCEKPTALNKEEAEQMFQLAKQHPNQLALLDHELRFLPSMKTMKKLIGEGKIGDTIFGMEAIIQSGGRIQQREWNWWHDKKQGGGILGAVGSHLIDSLCYLTGKKVVAVSGLLQSNIKFQKDPETGGEKPNTSDDYCDVQVKFTDNVIGRVHATVVRPGPNVHRIAIFGNKGTLTIDGPKLTFTPVATSSADVAVETLVDDSTLFADEQKDVWALGTVFIGQAIKAAVIDGNKEAIAPAATLEDGLNTQKFLDAVQLSNDENKWVQL